MRPWSEPDKEVFRKFLADQEAVFRDYSLAALTAKVARQTELASSADNTVDKCFVTSGKLSVPAKVHGTLHALRKCQAAATLREQEELEKLNANSAGWLQVRPRRFRVGWHAWVLRLPCVSLSRRHRCTTRHRPRLAWSAATPRSNRPLAVLMRSLSFLQCVATAKRAASSSWRWRAARRRCHCILHTRAAVPSTMTCAATKAVERFIALQEGLLGSRRSSETRIRSKASHVRATTLLCRTDN